MPALMHATAIKATAIMSVIWFFDMVMLDVITLFD
jgi:hypothetical protein